MKKNIRNYFNGVNTPIKTFNNIYKERVYLNSAATGLPLRNVTRKIEKLFPYYSFYKTDTFAGQKLTEEFEKVRDVVLDYVEADKQENTVIYVKSASYAIKLLSELLLNEDPNAVVLCASMNGLASYLPFKTNFHTDLIRFTPNGDIDLNDLEEKLVRYDGEVKLIAITGASNITGNTPPIYEAARIAHLHGARVFVDTTQLLQHQPFCVKPNIDLEHIDFIAFSAHKYYSPYDGGVLIGPTSYFENFILPNTGSYTTNFVNTNRVIYDNSPFCYETGYPNVLGIIGMSEALKTLKYFGLNRIKEYEQKLYNYTIKRLKEIKKVSIYGLDSNNINVPIVSFNIIDRKYADIASELGFKHGIVIGSGSLNSDLYVHYLLGLTPSEAYYQYSIGNTPGICRVSLSVYNNKSDIDRFIEALKDVIS